LANRKPASELLAPRSNQPLERITPFDLAREAALDFMVDLFLDRFNPRQEIEYWQRPTGNILILVLKHRRMCSVCFQPQHVFVIGKERACCKRCYDLKDCGDLSKAA